MPRTRVGALLEELQLTMGEGPGADDFGLGSPMLVPELGLVAGRWPGFVPAALAAGARAMFSRSPCKLAPSGPGVLLALSPHRPGRAR